nr:hypothetical protein [Allosalinactinospora lopnorensis]
MLHAHPRIAIPPETRFLLDMYWHRREFGDLREAANRRALAERIVYPKGPASPIWGWIPSRPSPRSSTARRHSDRHWAPCSADTPGGSASPDGATSVPATIRTSTS